MKKILLLIALVSSISCSLISQISPAQLISYTVDSSVLVSSLLTMNATVTTARTSINDNKDKFTEAEWARLEIAGEQIDDLKEQYSLVFGKDVGIKTRILSSFQLNNMMTDVFKTYDDVESIVLIHAERFEGAQRLQVLQAKTTIDRLKESYFRIRSKAELLRSDIPIDATDTIKHAVITIQKIAAIFNK